MRLFLILCLGLATACTSSPSSTPKGNPFVVKRADTLPAEFDDDLHTLLQSAAEGRDGDLLARIAPDITVSFGVENGHAAFVQMWKDPGKHAPWGRFLDAMETALSDGGTMTGRGEIQFPHHSEILRDDIDAFSLGRLPKGVSARLAPSSKSAALPLDEARTVLCATIGCRATDGAWVAITTASGTKGYAPASEMIPTLGQMRAIFEKRQAGWVLVAFVSGD